MWNVRIEDREASILFIRWEGKVTPEDVKRVNNKVEEYLKELQASTFDVIVEMNVVAWPSDTQQEVVKHQEWLLQKGMNRAAVIVNSAISKMQLKRTSSESSHTKEYHFGTFEEGMNFLKGA
ncbi:STAS/SEC14 domain-containing protein [Thalassobacillus sp. C254]|uniref:STAS/SEC14 domain-containing protein n=1 Tax=Thalassobacillus sp. C254 TaxID=1225341 RepID=UPI0006D09C47|nr:STAS/SEC14 domain-containing protein [Thalassobacillus sp. C254]